MKHKLKRRMTGLPKAVPELEDFPESANDECINVSRVANNKENLLRVLGKNADIMFHGVGTAFAYWKDGSNGKFTVFVCLFVCLFVR